MKYHVTLAGRAFEVDVTDECVRVDGRTVAAHLTRMDGTPVRSLFVDGRAHRLLAERRRKGEWRLSTGGWPLEAHVVDERTQAIRDMTGGTTAAAGPRPVVAPMPGMVVKVEVEVGDRVEPGQGVVIVEAMKMENELRASAAGRVKHVHVHEGEAVEKDQVLVELAPTEGEEAV